MLNEKKKNPNASICKKSFSSTSWDYPDQGSMDFTCTNRRGSTFPSSKASPHELEGRDFAVLCAPGKALPAVGSSPHMLQVTYAHSAQFRASRLGVGKVHFCGVSNKQNPDAWHKTFPKTIRPSLTAQRYWNFFSTTARIFLPFFKILFLTVDTQMPFSPQPCFESSLKLSLLKFSKKIQPEAATCEVSVQMVKGWRSFKQLKTGAYNQKCQAALIILFPEGNSFPCRSPGVIKKRLTSLEPIKMETRSL